MMFPHDGVGHPTVSPTSVNEELECWATMESKSETTRFDLIRTPREELNDRPNGRLLNVVSVTLHFLQWFFTERLHQS